MDELKREKRWRGKIPVQTLPHLTRELGRLWEERKREGHDILIVPSPTRSSTLVV